MHVDYFSIKHGVKVIKVSKFIPFNDLFANVFNLNMNMCVFTKLFPKYLNILTLTLTVS